MEHYIRMAQDVIDQSADTIGKRIIDPIRERPQVTEQELVSRLMASAESLGTAIVELSTWLDQVSHRKETGIGHKRGRERVENASRPFRPLAARLTALERLIRTTSSKD